MKIASNNPNRFIEKIELKIRYDVNKTGKDEVVNISLAEEPLGEKTLIAIEAEKYTDMDKFIFDLNQKSYNDKLELFDVRSNLGINKGAVIDKQSIEFSPHQMNGINQDGQLNIFMKLNTNFQVVDLIDGNNKLVSELNIVVKDLKIKYPQKQKSDIKINHNALSQKAKLFTSFATFLASEKDKVFDYILTDNRKQIVSAKFVEIPDKHTIQIEVQILPSFEFDNKTQQKEFTSGNIFYKGEIVPNMKTIDVSLNYSGLANFAKTKVDATEFMTEFNNNWALLLESGTILNSLSSEDKLGIESMKIEAPNGRSFNFVVSLKSGYVFSGQEVNNLSKTFKIINIRFSGEPDLALEQIDLSVNPRNLIDYIETYTDLNVFIRDHQENFLISNDNIRSILKATPYFADAVFKTNVYLNAEKSIVIDIETISGYYFNDYNNPYSQIIITIQDIKDYYKSLNDNSNSFEIDIDLYFNLLRNNASKFSNLDAFMLNLNQDSNVFNYLNIKLGNRNSIEKISLVKIPSAKRSFNFVITLKEGYWFANSLLNTKTILVNNLSFIGDEVNAIETNLELDIDSFVAEARNHLNFNDFNLSLQTLDDKLKFFIFVTGDKMAIKEITLSSPLEEPNTININIILNEGYYFSNEDVSQGEKLIVVNNVYYKNEVIPELKAVDLLVDGNALLVYAKKYANFKSMELILNKEEELMKFIKFSDATDIKSIENIFIYKGKYWNDFYVQVELKNNYYFKGQSQNKTYQSYLISNVRYSGDPVEELQEATINFNYDFLFKLFDNFDLNNFDNFSKENYQYLLNFNNNNSIIQISPLNSKMVQSAIMYHDSNGFYFEIKLMDGYYFDKDNQWNVFYRKNISFDELKVEHQKYLDRLSKINEDNNNLILILSLTGAFTLLAIIGTIIIVKVVKTRKRRRMDEE